MQTQTSFPSIVKRDGRVVAFDPEKITFAIFRALRAVEQPDRKEAERISGLVLKHLAEKHPSGDMPRVEEIQDAVEMALFESGHFLSAKSFIIYRKQHAELRNTKEILSNINLVDDYIHNMD